MKLGKWLNTCEDTLLPHRLLKKLCTSKSLRDSKGDVSSAVLSCRKGNKSRFSVN